MSLTVQPSTLLKRLPTWLPAAVLLFGAPLPARAQSSTDVIVGVGLSALSVSLVSSTVEDLRNSVRRALCSTSPLMAQAEIRSLEGYLAQNTLQLSQDFTLGGGPRLTEMALGLGVSPEELPAFNGRIRERRRELLDLARADRLTPERTLAFFRIVMELAGPPASSPPAQESSTTRAEGA